MKKIALILAGGKGNRFWPKSSPTLPKQFLKIYGNTTLLQGTVKRVENLIAPEDIYIITSIQYKNIVKEQIPYLPENNILLEPFGKDTAPALGYSALWLKELYKDAIMITLPSDHYVADEANWIDTLLRACQAAKSNYPVVIGIKPQRPEPGYGYIVSGESINYSLKKVTQFVEKPDLNYAQELIIEKNALWNSGMFIWKLSVIENQLAQYQPVLSEKLTDIYQKMKTSAVKPYQENIPIQIKDMFKEITPLSIDYGLMEPCLDLVTVSGSFTWDDLGNWQALESLYTPDSEGNINIGSAHLKNTENCIIEWKEGPAIIAGLKETVVVSNEGKLLICSKKDLPQLKGIVAEYLKEEDHNYTADGLLKTVLKPWGKEIWWAETDKYAAKILEINAGHSTSLHYHREKLETFYIEKGYGEIVIGSESEAVFPGKVLTIMPGTPHRLKATTFLRLFEVSTPQLDDVKRVADFYGR